MGLDIFDVGSLVLRAFAGQHSFDVGHRFSDDDYRRKLVGELGGVAHYENLLQYLWRMADSSINSQYDQHGLIFRHVG